MTSEFFLSSDFIKSLKLKVRSVFQKEIQSKVNPLNIIKNIKALHILIKIILNIKTRVIDRF